MTPRDRPEDERAGRNRWRRRGRGDREPADAAGADDELGWLAELRSAKEERTDIGPGPPDGPARTGRPAPPEDRKSVV